MTLLISMLLAVVSMFFARRVVREGEVSWLSRMTSRFRRKPRGERSRKPHNVWANPVAWREAVTRASATSRGIGRYVVVGCGALAAIVLLYYYLSGKGSFKVADARQWLAALVAVEFGLVLIIATNTAASALTKEKESKSMDILLTTPLTSSYIIWGKLRGLVSSVVPLIAVPTASLLLFAICDIVRRQHPRVVALEVGVELGLLMVVFSAYACLLGLHFSLKQRRTVRAVMISVGILVVVNLGATLFWQEIIDPTKSIGAGLAPGTPFTSVFVLINPDRLFATPGDIDRHLSAVRTAAVFGCAIFLAIHGTIVYSWYRSMVRGFDMIIRKQSGQF